METMQIDSTPQHTKAITQSPHSSSLVDTCTPIKKRKNYSNRMSTSLSSVEQGFATCDQPSSATDSNISSLSSGHNNEVDHDDSFMHQISSPIPHFQVGSLIRGGLRRDFEEDHLLLEQVEGALDSPMKTTLSSPMNQSNTPPRRKRSLDKLDEIPEWRKKEEANTNTEFSAFSSGSSTATPKKTRSRNGSFTTPQHGRSSWFRNVTPNKPSPASSDCASTDSTPTQASTDRANSSPFKSDLKNSNFTFQKFAPHALHVHCSLMKAKAPTVYMQNESKVDTDGRINYTFECGLSCVSRENTIMSASGKHHNKTHAKSIAARRLLSDLYPEFKGNLEQIIRFLDKELQEKKLNLRRILPNDVEMNKQQQQIKMANERLLKEGFNSMDTASESSSQQLPTQDSNKPASNQPNQYNFFHVPFEEAIKVLNELIHIRGYNYPTCQQREIEENGGTVQQVTMILEMPNDKGVYYSEGKAYDLKVAKGECSWKMLCYLFPSFNSNWYLIRDFVEDLRTKRKMEKLKKREETLVRRKLEFSNQEQSEDSRQMAEHSLHEYGKKGEEVLSKQVPPPPPMPPRDMNNGSPNWFYSNMHNISPPMNMYHHNQFLQYNPPINSHSMMFSNQMHHQHPYWYHPYQNNHGHCYCSSCVASNSNMPPPYYSQQQHSLFSQSFPNEQSQQGEYRSQKH